MIAMLAVFGYLVGMVIFGALYTARVANRRRSLWEDDLELTRFFGSLFWPVGLPMLFGHMLGERIAAHRTAKAKAQAEVDRVIDEVLG